MKPLNLDRQVRKRKTSLGLSDVLDQARQFPFYETLWRTAGFANAVEVLRAVEENGLSALPVVRKDHLRNHPRDLFCWTGASDVVSSSGTSGPPVDIPVHFEEERGRVDRVRRLLSELRIERGNRVLCLLSLNDLFALGPQVWEAIKAEGACAIRCSASRGERVLQVLEHRRPDVVVGNPFVMLRLAGQYSERWPEKMRMRAVLAVASTFDTGLRPTPVAQRVTQAWGLELQLSQYGSSEVGAIGFECKRKRGFHIHTDHHIVELINPADGSPVAAGEAGEVVVTAVSGPRGFFPVRYATGDVAAWLDTSTCPCGRRSPRLGSIVGRVDQQLKLSGQTVFPDLLLGVADETEGVLRSVVEVRHEPLEGDVVRLLIVVVTGADDDVVRRAVEAKLSALLAVAPSVEIVSEERLDRFEESASTRTNNVKIPRFYRSKPEGDYR